MLEEVENFGNFSARNFKVLFLVGLIQFQFDKFYKVINNIERSLIRTGVDESTYNLHVMMRLDLELDLLEGQFAIKDLPQAWNERFRSDFGIVPADDSNGVLQDVHWYSGTIGGAFQGYTLGDILSAKFYRFDTLQSWLREQIYQHGSKFTLNELIRRITGHGLLVEPYIHYLREKYGQLSSALVFTRCGKMRGSLLILISSKSF